MVLKRVCDLDGAAEVIKKEDEGCGTRIVPFPKYIDRHSETDSIFED
jgi:hypothetical protein